MGSSGAGRLRRRLRNTLVMMVKSQAFSLVPGLKRFRYRYARKYVSCTRSSASSGFLVRRSALRYSASTCLSKSEKSLFMPTPRWSILFRRICPATLAWRSARSRAATPAPTSTAAPAVRILRRTLVSLWGGGSGWGVRPMPPPRWRDRWSCLRLTLHRLGLGRRQAAPAPAPPAAATLLIGGFWTPTLCGYLLAWLLRPRGGGHDAG